jgi:translation initiation factor 5A
MMSRVKYLVYRSQTRKTRCCKARIDAVGLFDGVKRSIVQPVSAKIYVPVVERKSGQVITISGSTATLMDMKEYTNFEVDIPPDKAGMFEIGKELPYIEALGKRKLDIDDLACQLLGEIGRSNRYYVSFHPSPKMLFVIV